MQWFVFLWFQLQMTRQYLSERTFGQAESPANSANLNTPIGAGTLASVKRRRSKILLRIAACLAIVALAIVTFAQQARSSQVNHASPDAPARAQAPVQGCPEKAAAGQTGAEETVSVIHPEKSQTATLQLPGQLSAYADAPIYAQTSGYLKSWPLDAVRDRHNFEYTGSHVCN
jgi:hypothetical protein